MSSQLRISAKNLGELALPGLCRRCFWLKRHAKRLPFQIFPGIFSSIDSYTKKVVHAWMDRNDGAPFGLDRLGRVVDYIDPPSHLRFRMEIPEHDILLTGAPDGMLQLADGSIAIIDYKTAKFTPAQDELMPIYVVQLNGYAAVAEHLDYGQVSKGSRGTRTLFRSRKPAARTPCRRATGTVGPDLRFSGHRRRADAYVSAARGEVFSEDHEFSRIGVTANREDEVLPRGSRLAPSGYFGFRARI